ncbi:hypothetical protein JIG36_51050 [Actinoplanes sp. LDG1-06]|uniref:Uncharacterized protein n=1 Tax=Paractinoplanes ovalisporus TaxID=2810368 RepID=A0ABS2AWS7_9ACTN|nr:hypothetical protein [Actinoplanes ovalisporus]MBM2623858.1 hypothetical protein [Actinoplanes ovalisporus]
MSKLQDARDLAAVTADMICLTGQRYWLGTRTLPDGQLEADYADGTTARGSKEILAHAREALIRAERAADPRTLDADGFVMHGEPGPLGLRPSFGGLSSAVADQGGRVGIVTGLDTGPDGRLMLRVVWRPSLDPADPVPLDERDAVIAAVGNGDMEPETVAAYGMLALDLDADPPELHAVKIPTQCRHVPLDAEKAAGVIADLGQRLTHSGEAMRHLTCSEVTPLVELLVLAGQLDAACAVIEGHAAADDAEYYEHHDVFLAPHSDGKARGDAVCGHLDRAYASLGIEPPA